MGEFPADSGIYRTRPKDVQCEGCRKIKRSDLTVYVQVHYGEAYGGEHIAEGTLLCTECAKPIEKLLEGLRNADAP